jgi:hypothetical protein
MILAVAGSRAIVIALHFGIVLRARLRQATMLVHGGTPHPNDNDFASGLRSVDTRQPSSLRAWSRTPFPCLCRPFVVPRGASRFGAECSIAAAPRRSCSPIPRGRGTADSILAFCERGMPIVEVTR